MRYFFVFESRARQEARTFLASGVLALALAALVRLLFNEGTMLIFVLDVLGCVLLLCGTLLWNRVRLRKASLIILAAFFWRIVLVVWSPVGLFSFFSYLPFTLFILFGQLMVLEYYQDFLRGRAEKSEERSLKKAQQALARAEISFWIAWVLSYVSDLLAFPALVMFAFSLGVRFWVSYLLFRSPQFISSRSFFEKTSVRSQ